MVLYLKLHSLWKIPFSLLEKYINNTQLEIEQNQIHNFYICTYKFPYKQEKGKLDKGPGVSMNKVSLLPSTCKGDLLQSWLGLSRQVHQN